MRIIDRRRAVAALALATVLTAAGGCSRRGGRDRAAPRPVPLVVRNQGFFDVVVYIRKGAGPGMRLATVGGNSKAQLAVRASELQPGGMLVVQLHAIGTRYWWVSPELPVGADIVAQLDVYMDNDGNMSRSTLYSGPLDDGTLSPAPPSQGRAERIPGGAPLVPH